jgi:probable F420-dependent oxidoreductase
VNIGLAFFPTDESVGPAEVARAAEDRGFESIWIPEHSHIPISRKTPYPSGTPLPEKYRRMLDPFVALSAAAAVTERIRIATGICLVAQRDAIMLAKEVASLDRVSGGRFIFGIGLGWNEEEMIDHGVVPERRREIVRDKVQAMKALWTEEVAAYDGKFVQFEPCWMWPKPVQKPHPPIVIAGGGGPRGFRDLADYGNGWMPMHNRKLVLSQLPLMRQTLEDAGRDPDDVELSVFCGPPRQDVIDSYAENGFSRVILELPSEKADVVMPILDEWTSLNSTADST